MDLKEPDLFGQLPSANESHSVKPSSRNTGPTPQSTMTCEQSQQIDLEELTLFAEASHANLGVLQGSEEAQKMTVTSGRSWLPLLKSYNLDGSLAKMCEALLTNRWASSVVYLTWKASGIKPRHLLFQLAPWTPSTDETGSGLLHTPTATANQMSPSMRGRDPGSWWPTPTTDIGHERSKEYWINRIGKHQIDLQGAVKMWPTPTASDHRGAPKNIFKGSVKSHGNLSEEVRESQEDGQLNPQWVEWLMGFPEGWTDLKPSEMPSSRKSLSK